MELPRKYISYSQIKMYQSCPRRYYYTYIKDIQFPINDKVFLGIVFHAVVEYYFGERIKGIEPNRESVMDCYSETFDKIRQEQEIQWEVREVEVVKRGAAFVKYFLREVAPTIQPLMVEKELWADIPGVDVPLKGIIDLVEADFSITDFKTTTARWSKSKVKNSYLQVVMYRYLFEKNFGDVISLLKFKIIHAKSANSVKLQEVEVKPRDIDYDYTRMIDVVKYVVDSIRRDAFYRNENFTCGFCQYKDICRLDKET